MKNIFLALTILIVSTSCANLHIEKRRYNRGFHVGFTKKNQSKKEVKEKEELRLEPIGAFTSETIDIELILVSHQPIVHSIQVSTESTQLAGQTEIPEGSAADSNQRKLLNQTDRKSITKSDRVQKTGRFVTPRVIENKTTGHWGSNFKKLTSAESRGSDDVDWRFLGWLLLVVVLVGLVIAGFIFAGTSVGIIIILAIIAASLLIFILWCISEFLNWCMSIFDYL